MGIADLFSLRGRTALITGGSRGIGRMIAQGFLEHGARVYITARKADACRQAAEELSEYGYCTPLPCDVSTVKGCQELAHAFIELEPTLDILVNNAGSTWGEDFDAFPENGWDKVLNLNLKTPFFLTQKLAVPLRAAAKSRVGKVINITSIDSVGLNPLENYSYAASKAGLMHLTRRLSMRLARDNIAVSALAPGAFASEMNRTARDHAEELARHIPLGRIGSTEDMVGAAVFLASRAGDYVTGATLVLDGGVTQAQAYRRSRDDLEH